jgi:hypothetical protein
MATNPRKKTKAAKRVNHEFVERWDANLCSRCGVARAVHSLKGRGFQPRKDRSTHSR